MSYMFGHEDGFDEGYNVGYAAAVSALRLRARLLMVAAAAIGAISGAALMGAIAA